MQTFSYRIQIYLVQRLYVQICVVFSLQLECCITYINHTDMIHCKKMQCLKEEKCFFSILVVCYRHGPSCWLHVDYDQGSELKLKTKQLLSCNQTPHYWQIVFSAMQEDDSTKGGLCKFHCLASGYLFASQHQCGFSLRHWIYVAMLFFQTICTQVTCTGKDKRKMPFLPSVLPP